MDFKELENPQTLNMRDLAMRSAFSGGDGFCGSVELFFVMITNIIILVGAALRISILSPLLIVIIVIVVLSNSWINGKTNKNNYKLDQNKAPIERENNYVYNLINDFSIGKEVRLYELKKYILHKYKRTVIKSNNFYNKAFFNNSVNNLFSSATENIQLLFIYFVLAYQIVIKELFSYGDFIVQFTAINTLSKSVSDIVKGIIDINQKGYYINDLENFVNLPRTIDYGGKDAVASKYIFEFRNVSFKYPGAANYALEDINVQFSLNDRISLVGLNGAGKTTFIKLLLRLYDVDEGEIFLNGINVKEYNLAAYRKLFSAVFQDYKLFAYSIQENITFDEEMESNDELEKIIVDSGLDNVINNCNDGLKTYIYKIFDESGFEPSGGEGQKIAIARALYKKSVNIILDEPASALDPLAEYDLYTTINKMLGNRGCIFISHRLSSTSFAEMIYVFADGRIVERGNHYELMNLSNGLYKEMFEKQSSYYKK